MNPLASAAQRTILERNLPPPLTRSSCPRRPSKPAHNTIATSSPPTTACGLADGRRRDQLSLKIVLVGRVAARGRGLLKSHLKTPSVFCGRIQWYEKSMISLVSLHACLPSNGQQKAKN